ncbi:hypothetical protein GCM10020000_83720 [Streptomyces olivoverticillatus]
MNETSIERLLDRTLEATGLRDQSGEPLLYTPHDFRRMFATEAVTSGLPVHIAARILGHKTLTTTQAYLNLRELHQTGEKLQVGSSPDGREALRSNYALTS